jgi:GrpB-like predicted nucleotidyltransferase (UPF0157 family)
MPAIEIISHNDRWRHEFAQVALSIRQATRDLAVRIDHIGSTSVPGLAAKDVIDVQVSVTSLDPSDAIAAALNSLGYQWMPKLTQDHLPPGCEDSPAQWQKLYFRCPPAQRRTNLHVRVMGSANQRYAILFRDYLRCCPRAAEAYARVKFALARLHPEDAGAYYDVKDPACDLIMIAAESWADGCGWTMGTTDA